MIRCKVEVENVAAMQWLACQSIPIKTYWANRNQEFKMAGIGVAHEISGQETPDLKKLFQELHLFLDPKYPELRYYGGFQFNRGSKPSQEWKSFGAYRFIIPQFELHRSEAGTFLVYNFLHEGRDSKLPGDLTRQLDDVQFELTLSDWEERTILHRRDIPDRAEWQSSLDTALEEMGDGKYEKVVLARKATLTFNDPVDPVAYLLRLRRMTEETFNFYFQADEGHAFLGATPERLFRRQGRTLHTEAIAGTRPRGLTTRDDERYARALLNSEKEVREHSIVVDMIQNVLEKYCHNLVMDEKVQITRLSHVQHLCKHFKAELDPETSDADLIEALHPTPAMGGFPTDIALEAIDDLEPFNRGWYAAPIGFVGHDHTEFVVGIRSALVEQERVSLYSGAGIVLGSDPAEEWQEIEDKISKFLKALDL
ncbi:MAG: isochorismate synthase [Candidatus Marinimicrobia bacterium]|nr:isochorismate synthase [Candidatus Neomarinimicrobiota bacterium]MBT3631442.1 isochorismate synthase [Candidatus Neomarinimicrobiota bacterium]MBT3825441.1 isochorismate synthase [Candidatus Neomarinimicrobiota bacterium]MBT4131542.1 isochorismate synthase [Candidatus Neomarinimicrobiota bacterium]MBT4294869.1 isochorismate synthase [Candidatus Neomarinimicrobiota bacterium]